MFSEPIVAVAIVVVESTVFPVDVRFERLVLPETARFVDVEFVRVALVTRRLVIEDERAVRRVVKKLVEVALVIVPLVEVRFSVFKLAKLFSVVVDSIPLMNEERIPVVVAKEIDPEVVDWIAERRTCLTSPVS
jgi:phage terminase Nu1 subunit (DNA packaging protein)